MGITGGEHGICEWVDISLLGCYLNIQYVEDMLILFLFLSLLEAGRPMLTDYSYSLLGSSIEIVGGYCVFSPWHSGASIIGTHRSGRRT